MRSATGAGATRPVADPVVSTAGRERVFTWLAAAGIGSSILIMIAVSLVRDSWMVPPIIQPAAGPPWDLQSVHMTIAEVAYSMWAAVILGTGGVAAGLVAVRRGARPDIRVLLVAAGVVIAVLTVLPPVGSTDIFDYASYGRIMLLGHNPYLMTPYHLRIQHNVFARSVPITWQRYTSVYGPFATLEQFLAAKLGGLSAARVTFWLKLWNAIAFAAVALVADRLLRRDPARRLRAHLLWTINPLMLWGLVASGHVDALAAAVGLLGLLVLGQHSVAARPPLPRVLAAGALLGLSADVKLPYVLFGMGMAWALRRSLTALATAAAGALAVLVPTYSLFGFPAVRALSTRRNLTSADSFYRAFLWSSLRPHIGLIAGVLGVAAAVLLYRRLPEGIPGRPAVRTALVLSTAWLFFWPYQFPWYDTMLVCLLILYPASRLDWLVLIRMAAGTMPNIPGEPPYYSLGPVVGIIHNLFVHVFGPMVLLATAVCLIWLCLTRRWNLREPGGPPDAAPEPAELLPTATS